MIDKYSYFLKVSRLLYFLHLTFNNVQNLNYSYLCILFEAIMKDYKDKIKKVRDIIPAPMSEVLKTLKENDGDVTKSIAIIKQRNIIHICQQTGCTEQEAAEEYHTEKYDLNRTISSIREKNYDRNYRLIEGVTRDNVRSVLDWMHTVDKYDFISALSFDRLDIVINTLSAIPTLTDVASKIKEAKKAKDIILAGEEHMSNEEFIKQNTILDVHPACIEGSEYYRLKHTIINEETLRHLRNLS